MQAILHLSTTTTIRMFHIAHCSQSEDTDNPPLLDVGNRLATVAAFLHACTATTKAPALSKGGTGKDALATLPELAVKILDYVRDQGRVTTRDMVREIGASPNTLKATFTSFVDKGLLLRHGGRRST